MFLTCEDCEAIFTDMEQTMHEHKNGICPVCGSERVTEYKLKPMKKYIENGGNTK